MIQTSILPAFAEAAPAIVGIARQCDLPQCGAVYVPQGNRSRYCSEKCADQAQWERRSARLHGGDGARGCIDDMIAALRAEGT